MTTTSTDVVLDALPAGVELVDAHTGTAYTPSDEPTEHDWELRPAAAVGRLGGIYFACGDSVAADSKWQTWAETPIGPPPAAADLAGAVTALTAAVAATPHGALLLARAAGAARPDRHDLHVKVRRIARQSGFAMRDLLLAIAANGTNGSAGAVVAFASAWGDEGLMDALIGSVGVDDIFNTAVTAKNLS